LCTGSVFGGQATQVTQVISDSVAVCQTPAHLPGIVNVTISLNGQQYTEDSLPFSYVCMSVALLCVR